MKKPLKHPYGVAVVYMVALLTVTNWMLYAAQSLPVHTPLWWAVHAFTGFTWSYMWYLWWRK